MLGPARFLAILLGFTAAAAGSAAAAVDQTPAGLIPSSASLATVRALYERAHTGEHNHGEIIETWRLAEDHLTGTYRVYRLGANERTVTTLGPFTFQKGVRYGIHWQQTRNGETYTYPGFHQRRDAISERAWTSPSDTRDVRLIGESVPLNAYVVEIDPPGGRLEWLFVDKRTGNVLRSEKVRKNRRFTTSYEDFRTFDGLPEPSRVRTTDSFGNERDLALVSRTLDLAPDAKDVAIPPSRRSLVAFPPARPFVRLPVRIVNGLIVTRVRIGSQFHDFLLDSGAAGIVVDRSIVEALHLPTFGVHVGSTIGTFSETASVVPAIQIGALLMRSVVVRVAAVPFRLDPTTPITGLIGFDFFADAVVHIDLEHGLAAAIAPAAFHPPADARTRWLAFDDRTPTVRAKAGAAWGRIVLDTGANRSVFTTAFAQRADFPLDQNAVLARFRGMGGTATAEAVRIKAFDLAGLTVDDPTVDVSDADLGAEDVDGTAGTDILRAYDLWFDYRAGHLYLRRAVR